jgi:hypothetical protein
MNDQADAKSSSSMSDEEDDSSAALSELGYQAIAQVAEMREYFDGTEDGRRTSARNRLLIALRFMQKQHVVENPEYWSIRDWMFEWAKYILKQLVVPARGNFVLTPLASAAAEHPDAMYEMGLFIGEVLLAGFPSDEYHPLEDLVRLVLVCLAHNADPGDAVKQLVQDNLAYEVELCDYWASIPLHADPSVHADRMRQLCRLDISSDEEDEHFRKLQGWLDSFFRAKPRAERHLAAALRALIDGSLRGDIGDPDSCLFYDIRSPLTSYADSRRRATVVNDFVVSEGFYTRPTSKEGYWNAPIRWHVWREVFQAAAMVPVESRSRLVVTTLLHEFAQSVSCTPKCVQWLAVTTRSSSSEHEPLLNQAIYYDRLARIFHWQSFATRVKDADAWDTAQGVPSQGIPGRRVMPVLPLYEWTSPNLPYHPESNVRADLKAFPASARNPREPRVLRSEAMALMQTRVGASRSSVPVDTIAMVQARVDLQGPYAPSDVSRIYRRHRHDVSNTLSSYLALMQLHRSEKVYEMSVAHASSEYSGSGPVPARLSRALEDAMVCQKQAQATYTKRLAQLESQIAENEALSVTASSGAVEPSPQRRRCFAYYDDGDENDMFEREEEEEDEEEVDEEKEEDEPNADAEDA